MRHRVRMVAAVLVLLFTLTAAVQACPSCKAANETDSRRPKAYMYSILFMLGVPATMATGFGVGFYRMNKRYRAAMDARYRDDLQLPANDDPQT